MSQGVHVDDTEVRRALGNLADATRHLEPAHKQAGELLLDRADSQVPRQSGRLAASGRVDATSDETALVYDEVYAGVIHNGWPAHNIAAQPWLLETVDQSTAEVADVFVDYLGDSIRRF